MPLIVIVVVAIALVAALGLDASTRSIVRERDRLTEAALAQAREALVAYAAGHAINASVGPGYLPCPDLDNDGWAESTCGSLSGEGGQAQRLGRLPWKTLGLPDLRDGFGERLWYAVSSKHKGLLNCAASRTCVDMAPASALGTITVRDAAGAIVHDGTIGDPARAESGGVAAVVLAPGPALARQRRECAPGECDASGQCLLEPPQRVATCDPANYLDAAEGLEDNARFVDRNDAAGRALNRDGFIAGPVMREGRVVVNDRIAVIAYGDLMPRVMRRVALEVAACLRFYASRPQNAGRLPAPAPACADPAATMHESPGATEGRVPDTPFDASAAAGGVPRWWRASTQAPERLDELPTRDDACRIAIAPEDPGPVRSAGPGTPSDEGSTAGHSTPSWWSTWKAHVTLAYCGDERCRVEEAGGRTLAKDRVAAVVVRRRAAACGEPVRRCVGHECVVTLAAGDAVAWLP
jgi:hypothetical protein